MKIRVTQEDIDSAEECRDSEDRIGISDPLTNAIHRVSGQTAWMVGTHFACYNAGKLYPLPKSCQKFLRDFDDGKKVHPRIFVIPGIEKEMDL